MAENDAELLAEYRAGNVEALETLVNRYRRQLFGFILNMLGRSGEEDEVFQEVWLKAIRKIDTYKHKYFLAWLIQIARNLIIDRWRRKKPSASLDRENEQGGTVLDTIAGNELDPAGMTADKDLGRRIAAAIGELPEEQKEVVLMRVKADLSFKEIAAIQGVSINTALARMQYGLSKLRTLLRDEAIEALVIES
jgi:RNA polymerase sigma-70 factor (ECF subfamily)